MKRWVFNLDLKVARDFEALSNCESLLYSMGAKTEKAQDPYDFVLGWGITSEKLLAGLRDLLGV